MAVTQHVRSLNGSYPVQFSASLSTVAHNDLKFNPIQRATTPYTCRSSVRFAQLPRVRQIHITLALEPLAPCTSYLFSVF